MNETKKHLFIFTVGPVQSFIAQARKTQDLYAGSQILSALVREAIECKELEGCEVVFPIILDKKDKNQSLPNRFVSIVEKPNNELKAWGNAVEKVVTEKFEEIAKKTLDDNVSSKLKSSSFDDLFLNQIKRHLDIHWAFHPLTKGNYSKNYKETEALLGSVKNVRSFEQFGNELGEAGRKCSLDGENNALFFGRKQPYLSIEEQREYAVTLRGYSANEKEGLSAVSFVKRFFKEEKSHKKEEFPSTTLIALMDSLDKIEDKSKEKFHRVFGEKNVFYQLQKEGCLRTEGKEWVERDDQFYYEENLIEKYIPCKQQLDIAKREYKELQKAFRAKEVKFDKYYALIMFDGDKMGDKLSNADDKEKHRVFSTSLTQFSKEAREIVDKYGQTVYAGGDDFLGFVNLHHLFEVMTHLRTSFEGLVSKRMKDLLKIDEDFTFSAGIVITHYKMPLAEVLKTARKMEKKAKKEGGRDAFCITSMKHSGEIQEAVFKWGENNQQWDALQYITEQLSSGVFSNKFITNLTIELYQLAGVKLDSIGISNEAVFVEFKRLAKRGLIEKSNKVSNEKKVNSLVDKLELLYRSSRKTNEKTKNFIHALHIADFLSRKIN